MLEQAYHFRASFPDVDFQRILSENPKADFIIVRWTPGGASYRDGIVLVSKRGVDRMAAAGITQPPMYHDVKLDKKGESWLDGPEGGDPIYVVSSIDKFGRILAKIKKYEKQRHWISVTAIR